jgi:hypothetical protein
MRGCPTGLNRLIEDRGLAAVFSAALLATSGSTGVINKLLELAAGASGWEAETTHGIPILASGEQFRGFKFRRRGGRCYAIAITADLMRFLMDCISRLMGMIVHFVRQKERDFREEDRF